MTVVPIRGVQCNISAPVSPSTLSIPQGCETGWLPGAPVEGLCLASSQGTLVD